MTWGTFTALLASSMALLVSIGALIATVRSYRLCLSSSAAVLSAQLSDLQTLVELQQTQIRNLKSRYSMQNVRLMREATPPAATEPTDPDAIAAEKRRELNDMLANGQLKVHP